MSDNVTKKRSVFTKGEMQGVLTDIRRAIAENPDEIVNYLDGLIKKYSPGTRGRRLNIDLSALQTTVDATAKKMVGAKPNSIVTMAASAWNTRKLAKGETLQPLDGAQLKQMVLKGKLTLPDGLAFERRPRKPRNVAPAAEVGSETTAAQPSV